MLKTNLIIGMLLLFTFGVSVDQFSKRLALKTYPKPQTDSLIHIKLTQNKGFLGGSLQSASPMLRFLVVGMAGFSLIALYFILLFFLKHLDLAGVKLSLTAIMVGIVGNLWDKIYYGFVIDFIQINLSIFKYVVFNVADVFLVLGVVSLIISIFYYRKILFYPTDKRRGYLIHPSYQVKVSFIWFMGFMILGLAQLSFGYSYFKHYAEIEAGLMRDYFWASLFLTLIISLIGFIFSILVSHKTAGPIEALKNYVKNPKPTHPFKTREGDFHPELTEIAEKFLDTYKKRFEDP